MQLSLIADAAMAFFIFSKIHFSFYFYEKKMKRMKEESLR